MSRGVEVIEGLGHRKLALLGAGANRLDLAIAMLETNSMHARYPIGDLYPDGLPKTGDAANFGVFKQNWFAIRSAFPRYRFKGPEDYREAVELNGDLRMDVAVLHASQQHFGLAQTWFRIHRGGESALAGPISPDVAAFHDAVWWIESQLASTPANMSNDLRFWVAVQPV